MDNSTHNVLKLLHDKLDELWRIEKFYQKDAEMENCDCPQLLRRIQDDLKKHVDALKTELMKHEEMNVTA